MIEEITNPPFLDDTAQEMVTKLQAIANNINNNAGQVSYSNTTSQLQAETVQTAIDEVKGITDTISASLAQLENNKSATFITITSYTDANNPYVAPCDGYVRLDSNTASSGTLQVRIRTANDINLANMYMPITNIYQMQSIFVKKGFKINVPNAPTGSVVYFGGLNG